MSDLKKYRDTLDEIREAGLYKTERIITTPQSVEIKVQDGSEVLNFCANNYLGLADNPEVIKSSAPTTRSFTPPVSTQMAACSKPSWGRMTQ
jgi:7-keto-8-aminopelargonate synthetase-like enzyme